MEGNRLVKRSNVGKQYLKEQEGHYQKGGASVVEEKYSC